METVLQKISYNILFPLIDSYLFNFLLTSFRTLGHFNSTAFYKKLYENRLLNKIRTLCH